MPEETAQAEYKDKFQSTRFLKPGAFYNTSIEASGLIEFAKTLDGTSAAELASKINKNTNAYAIGELLNKTGVALSEKNLSDIRNNLESRGVAPAFSGIIAKWLNNVVEGGTLSTIQQLALTHNPVISEAFADIVLNRESSVNQRTQAYRDIMGKNNTESNMNTTSSGNISQNSSAPQLTANAGNGIIESNNQVEKTADSSVRYSRSYPNEFFTYSEGWAKNPGTKSGDTKVFNKGKTFVLLMADGKGGYVELKSGKYAEVAEEYDRIISDQTSSIDEDIEQIRSKQRGSLYDSGSDGDGANDNGNRGSTNSSNGNTDTSANTQHLRESDTESSANDINSGEPPSASNTTQHIQPSEESLNIMQRLANGEEVSIDEIYSVEQISEAVEESLARPETAGINTPERAALREKVKNDLLSLGSAVVDSNGKVEYNGNVKQESRADIVIGLPAAGKSSTLVDPLSQFYQSRVIDSDMAKERLPEFDNGIGANAVHKESQNIIKNVLDESVANGDNIVYPIVGGGDVSHLITKIEEIKTAGYSVYLHLNELPNGKALGRALNRYFETGRLIIPKIIIEYGDTPTQNFYTILNREGLLDGYTEGTEITESERVAELGTSSESSGEPDERRYPVRRTVGTSEETQSGETAQATEGLIDGYTHYSNDVEKGAPPELIASSESCGEFTRHRSINYTTKSENNEATSENEAASFISEDEPQDTVKDNGTIFSEPSNRDIAEPYSNQDFFDRINGIEKTTVQKHVEKLTKLLDGDIRVVFDPDLKQNGKYNPATKVLTLNANLSTAEMYVEVFKHEFVHRLELRKTYGKVKDYLFKRSIAFEQYARTCLANIAGERFNGNRAQAIDALTEYYYQLYKSDESIPPYQREKFTLEDAKREMVADFVGDILFKGKEYRTDIAEALESETEIPTGDYETSLNALEELAAKDRNLFQKIIDAIKELISKIKGYPQARQVSTDLEYLENRLSQLYDSADMKKSQTDKGMEKFSFKGYANDGKGMYESNFPMGTPKTAKAKVILDYIQNVWSKKPIKLKVEQDGSTKEIFAQFDPTYDESGNIASDATKLMGGNRHGTARDQRVTLDLADDYYKIAEDSKYNYSKAETGKTKSTHEGVLQWHYFVNEIYFAEKGSKEYTPYTVTINVKEKADGNFVYSFSAEKEGNIAPQTLHAVVKDENVPNELPSTNSIPNSSEDVNTNDSHEQYSLAKPQQQLRYNPEIYAKWLARHFKSNTDTDTITQKLEAIVKADNTSQKENIIEDNGEISRNSVADRLIQELSVEMAESVKPPLNGYAYKGFRV